MLWIIKKRLFADGRGIIWAHKKKKKIKLSQNSAPCLIIIFFLRLHFYQRVVTPGRESTSECCLYCGTSPSGAVGITNFAYGICFCQDSFFFFVFHKIPVVFDANLFQKKKKKKKKNIPPAYAFRYTVYSHKYNF